MDPYLIDPELRKRQAQGMAALQELQGIPKSADYAMALRDANTPIAQQGNPAQWGYAGPTFLDALVNLGTRAQGRQNLRAIDSRSQALRQQAQAGTQAELDAAELARQQEMQQAMGPMETFVGKDQQLFTVQRNRRGDVNRVNALDGATPYALPRATGKGGGSYAWELKQATPAIEMMKNIDDIRAVVDKFTDDDEKVINQLAKRLVQKAFTPEALEQYIQMNWNGYSREVREYLTKMLAVSAEERHRLAGSALTKTENSITNAFLPSAEGITLADRMDRIGGIYNRAWNKLKALDETAKSDYSTRYPRWKRWDRPSRMTDTPEQKMENSQRKVQRQLSTEDEQLFDEYMQLSGDRHPDDPRGSFHDALLNAIGDF